MKRWYIIHAYSGYEKQVMRSLKERIQRSAVADSFGDVLVPTEEVVEMKDGKKRKSERKFFPGYVLVEMEMNDDTWHIVKECPKVLGFIGGTPEKPAPITQREADGILARVRNTGEAPRPKTMFEPGEELLVIDGPFTDFKGVVEEVQYDKSRLTLTINVFNRPTQVELEFRQVEKTI
ncbi:transcription termination/antitermination protein NusG [Acinetobacter baumannii]|uniref:transcription termination/antitermination protein NusG n=1 Tax=Acinetobacter baumannii TaxID=470 RepID=UPI00028E655F|nr:transcription termination/antitermination protein NusG [Acinetobacter baumannii]EHU1403763.1 transcription termination/antitermination protein NusG [Acinetobacter baumannii]EHU2351058.1 transcription termination/antitermination protein NusG [Acinetobacter baumannii]EHU2371517.1 transcription termination/antitermination protein NusG [Acinetobacter baumannii]EHU2565303.1 transcription termination/antitermination protein NusG [Acinetobacter baumannii]EHU2574030.1 transcription termination/anti